METLPDGWNVLTGSDEEKILFALKATIPAKPQRDLYPAGASEKIRTLLNERSELQQNRSHFAVYFVTLRQSGVIRECHVTGSII